MSSESVNGGLILLVVVSMAEDLLFESQGNNSTDEDDVTFYMFRMSEQL